MDFTEVYRQSSSLVAFSPGGHFILTVVEDRIIVRRTDNFQITRTWLVDASPSQTNFFLSNKVKTSQGPSSTKSDAWITHCGWSCDSEYILAACTKHGVVHILKLRDEGWSARIEAGAEGDPIPWDPWGYVCLVDERSYKSRMGPWRSNDTVFLGVGCTSVSNWVCTNSK